MKIQRKAFAAAVIATLVVPLAACTGDSSEGAIDGKKCEVGISMPTRAVERWVNDGTVLREQLNEAGCKAEIQYADNKVDVQISQIQNQLAGGANILVIAAIDGEVLAPVLSEAKKQDVTVIAYDRLINGTEDVDYYATFDNGKVGRLQAEYIEEKLDLKNGAGPFNLEPFAGSPDDNNAKFFFSGAWDILLPYVEGGQLVVPSGKAPKSNDDWASIGIPGWSSEKAQAELDNRLSSFYSGAEQVDAVLLPNDTLAIGVVASLRSAGYKPGDGYPILTGQDADTANVKAILAGEQAMTVWTDGRVLAKRAAEMIKSIVGGTEVEVNDTETYNNGVKTVPAYLCDPTVVTKEDVQTELIDSGWVEAADVGL